MSKKSAEAEPAFSVRQFVDVELSKSEVEEALRAWLRAKANLVPAEVPGPAGEIAVIVYCCDDNLLGARLSYAPEVVRRDD